MPYAIEWRPAAEKALRTLPRAHQVRIVRRIDTLAKVPRPPGCEKLAATGEDLYRIRSGAYRILYQIRDDRLIVLIVRVGHRRDVYR